MTKDEIINLRGEIYNAIAKKQIGNQTISESIWKLATNKGEVDSALAILESFIKDKKIGIDLERAFQMQNVIFFTGVCANLVDKKLIEKDNILKFASDFFNIKTEDKEKKENYLG